jgi:hypothetical protein
MVKTNLKLMILGLVILSIFPFSFVAVVRGYNEAKLKTSCYMDGVIIDGNITYDEWQDADWNISFFLDIDNDPDYNGKINVDGNNTMYLGEDKTNLYIGLDLKCDRSDNGTGEWVGVWLNNHNRSFDSYPEWINFLNDGTESLVHNVEEDKTWVYYSKDDFYYQIYYLNDDAEYNLVSGLTEGTSYNFEYLGRDDFNITSVASGSDYIHQIDFSVDISEWIYFADPLDVIQMIYPILSTKHNTTIDEYKFIIWNSNGSIPQLDHPDNVVDLNTGTSYIQDKFFYGLGNLTSEYKLQFSLFANNSAPFTTNLNVLNFQVMRNDTNYAGPVNVPYSSINNYQIAWSFGPSPDNSTDHRMFEIAIPKNELELYKSYKDLGIVVGGYGTMAFKGTNYWCFSEIDTWIPVDSSDNYLYYNMLGPYPSEKIPGYDLYFILAIIGAVSFILFHKRIKSS